MKVPPYPKYRQSGEEWLPELPEGWDLVALRWLSQRYAGGTPDKGNSAYWDEGDIPWLNSGAVNDGYITEPSEYITREGYLGSSAKWIPKGALVLALAGQGKTKGMVAQLGIDTTCNQSMAAIIPARRIQARYLYWWLTSNYFNIRNMAGGEARDGLNLDLLGNIPCPVPRAEDQRTISALLDRETVKIDTLMGKKQTLIERLKEKRTAVISRTVTRGLPPDAARAAGLDPHTKLKHSGVDWLGDVPEHWEVSRIKHIKAPIPNAFVDGPFGSNLKTEHFVDDGDVLVIESGFATQGELNESALKQIELAHFLTVQRSATAGGDIIIAKIGANFGLNNVLPSLSKPAVVSGNSLKLTVNPRKCLAKFLHFQLLYAKRAGAIDLLANTTAQPALSLGAMNDLECCMPPIHEQDALILYIDGQLSTLDGMVAKVEEAIERLREYRIALITAAVTGEIDVREAVE